MGTYALPLIDGLIKSFIYTQHLTEEEYKAILDKIEQGESK